MFKKMSSSWKMAVLSIHLLQMKTQDSSLVNFRFPAIMKRFPKSSVQNQRTKNQYSTGFLRSNIKAPGPHTAFWSPAAMQTLVLEIYAWPNQKVPKIVPYTFFFGQLLDGIVLNPNIGTTWEKGKICGPRNRGYHKNEAVRTFSGWQVWGSGHLLQMRPWHWGSPGNPILQYSASFGPS